MKITKRQLRRIIKEERARILSESPMRLNSLATKEFAQAVKGKTAISEAYQYDPLSEVYDIQQHLSDAGHKMKEVADFIGGEVSDSAQRRATQFENLSRQILKINTIIESHVKSLEDSGRETGQSSYRDDLDSGDIV